MLSVKYQSSNERYIVSNIKYHTFNGEILRFLLRILKILKYIIYLSSNGKIQEFSQIYQ